MNSLNKMTPEAAPRDQATLARLGRYRLRGLAESLGIVNNPETKSAYMEMPVDEQARRVLEALSQFDAGGGTPPPQAAQQATPATVAQPSTGFGGGFRGAAQAAAAVAAPAPAVEAPKTKLTRTPRNSGAGNGAPAAQQTLPGTQTAPAGTPIATLDISPVLVALKGINDKLDTQNANLGEIYRQIEEIRNTGNVTFSALLLLAEKVLDVERPVIIDESVKDIVAVLEHTYGLLGKGAAPTK